MKKKESNQSNQRKKKKKKHLAMAAKRHLCWRQLIWQCVAMRKTLWRKANQCMKRKSKSIIMSAINQREEAVKSVAQRGNRNEWNNRRLAVINGDMKAVRKKAKNRKAAFNMAEMAGEMACSGKPENIINENENNVASKRLVIWHGNENEKWKYEESWRNRK